MIVFKMVMHAIQSCTTIMTLKRMSYNNNYTTVSYNMQDLVVLILVMDASGSNFYCVHATHVISNPS